MRIFIQYEKYKIPRDTYSDISFRQLTCKLIRSKKEEGFNRLWWILYSFLEPILAKKCLDIYKKNKFYEAGTEILDTLHLYMNEVMEVVLQMDKPYLNILETDQNMDRFKKACVTILINIYKKNRTRSINFAEKKKSEIEYSVLECEGVKDDEIRFRNRISNYPDFVDSIHNNQIYESMYGFINGIQNSNRKTAIQLLLEDKSYEEISMIMGLPLNTLYTHIYVAKKQIKNHLIKERLIA